MTRTFKVGDRVQATGTVVAAIDHDGDVRVLFDACPVYIDADALTLITPDEPPVGSAVLHDGVLWVHMGFRDTTGLLVSRGWADPLGGYFAKWSGICDGDILHRAGE